MTRTGPQKYPGASQTYRYQGKYPGDAMESNVVVWHSTEGTSLPDYRGGADAPNFTAKPDFKAKKIVWYQHFDFDTSSRALVNLNGGVETNTLNAVQVEIVGTCDPGTHKRWGSTPHLYMPSLPDWAVRDLAAFAKWAHDNHGVPLTSGVTFKAYPGSYGTNNGVRMSGAKWSGFKGHCGHQHVPENLHGDPGTLPMAAILKAAGKAPVKTPPAKTPPDRTPIPPVTQNGARMDYTDISRTTARIINPGEEYVVYFDGEASDEPNDHGDGGKTFLTGARYTGTVSVWVPDTTTTDPVLRVQMRQELADGTTSVSSSADLDGSVVDTVRAVSVTGTVPADRKMTVVLVNLSSVALTVPRVQLRLLSQAL